MIRFYVLLIPFASFIQSAYSGDKPLIFNPYTLEIYDIGDKSSTYKNRPYAAACPAMADKHEQDFNEKYSLNNKSLIVRHFSKEKDDLMNRIRCTNNVEISVAYYKDPTSKIKYLKYGYEIYFTASSYPDFNKDASYSHYKRAFSKKKRFLRAAFGSFTKVPSLVQYVNFDFREKKMGFIWISKATLLEFNKSKWRSNSSYSINRKVARPAINCDNYKLHERWHNKKPLDYYYSSRHQEEIFKSVKLLDGDCKSIYNCVEKYSLVPAYQLQTSKSASCTDFATVPIWSKTAVSLLDSLDRFLFAVAQVIDDTRKLVIFPHVYDTLTLPTDDEKIPEKQMYLDPEKKKLEIPKYILKLVTYQTHDCNVTIAVCWYLVVIVIHNHPTVTQTLCEQDKCQQLGWKSIKYTDKDDPKKESEHIYCCEMNEIMKQIFKFPRLLEFKNLNLTQFPRYDEDTKKYKTDENKVDLIEGKMKYFFGDETLPGEGQSSSSSKNDYVYY